MPRISSWWRAFMSSPEGLQVVLLLVSERRNGGLGPDDQVGLAELQSEVQEQCLGLFQLFQQPLPVLGDAALDQRNLQRLTGR